MAPRSNHFRRGHLASGAEQQSPHRFVASFRAGPRDSRRVDKDRLRNSEKSRFVAPVGLLVHATIAGRDSRSSESVVPANGPTFVCTGARNARKCGEIRTYRSARTEAPGPPTAGAPVYDADAHRPRGLSEVRENDVCPAAPVGTRPSFVVRPSIREQPVYCRSRRAQSGLVRLSSPGARGGSWRSSEFARVARNNLAIARHFECASFVRRVFQRRVSHKGGSNCLRF